MEKVIISKLFPTNDIIFVISAVISIRIEDRNMEITEFFYRFPEGTIGLDGTGTSLDFIPAGIPVSYRLLSVYYLCYFFIFLFLMKKYSIFQGVFGFDNWSLVCRPAGLDRFHIWPQVEKVSPKKWRIWPEKKGFIMRSEHCDHIIWLKIISAKVIDSIFVASHFYGGLCIMDKAQTADSFRILCPVLT